MGERPQQVIDPEPSGHDPPIGDLVLAFEAPAVDAEQNLDAVADLLDSLSWCYSPIELGEQANVMELVGPSGGRCSIAHIADRRSPISATVRYLLPTASQSPWRHHRFQLRILIAGAGLLPPPGACH